MFTIILFILCAVLLGISFFKDKVKSKTIRSLVQIPSPQPQEKSVNINVY